MKRPEKNCPLKVLFGTNSFINSNDCNNDLTTISDRFVTNNYLQIVNNFKTFAIDKSNSKFSIESIDGSIIKEILDFFGTDIDEEFLFLIVELIGILLGDGNIWDYGFKIDLNRIDEAKYVDYVNSLIFTIFNRKPNNRNRQALDGTDNGAGIRLSLYGKSIINFLVKIGLKIGHKIRNEAQVPIWVLNNRPLIPFCLKGFFDTDGNVDIHTKERSLVLRFVSGSHLLANNFKDMCEKIDINASINKQKNYGYGTWSWVVSIGSKENVRKFIEVVKPTKFLFRKKLIGMRLIVLEDPIKKEIVFQKEQETFSEKKLIRQTKKYKIFLKNIFSEYKWQNNDHIIEKFINNSLTLKSHPYNISLAEKLKILFENEGTIDDAMKKLEQIEGFRLNNHTVKKHIKKLFNSEHYIKIYSNANHNPLEVNGKNFYDKWDNNNSRIIIDSDNKRVFQFNQNLKIQIAIYIYKILSKLENPKESSDEKILYHIEKLANQSPFLGRLSYIFNDNTQNQIILSYLRVIIRIVEFYINNPKHNKSISNYEEFIEYIKNKRLYHEKQKIIRE
jgi:hypothetical protein